MTPRLRRALVAVALIGVAVAAVAAVVCGGGGGKASTPSPGVYRFESDGIRYEFHTPTGIESLFDLRADPRALKNLSVERPDATREYRERLEKRLDVKSLDELRNEQSDAVRRLHGLGYL